MTHFRTVLTVALTAFLLTGCFRRQKYENPITKDTAQPDKILFDSAIHDLERGRYRIARLTLQTLINTYDTSEYIAKAKLALADSWYREGGAHGLAQAEAEYKDFILFYPTMEEAAEAQSRVCMIHYRQMEKPDRDPMHAIRADDECRQLMVQFPNSKYAPEMEQRLREIQEIIAEGEYRVGDFYFKKGRYAAATNRLHAVVNHYPLYSKADKALWEMSRAYSKMGPRFKASEVDSLQRIVRDYPLSPLAKQAKQELQSLEKPIPDPDPVAVARMEYEKENAAKITAREHFFGIFKKHPNIEIKLAAKSGTPASTPLRPTIPLTVPGAAATSTELSTEVTVSTVNGPSALDTKPDARRNPPGKNQKKNPQGKKK